MERLQFLHARHDSDLAKLESKVHMEDNRIKADFFAKLAGIENNIDTVERQLEDKIYKINHKLKDVAFKAEVIEDIRQGLEDAMAPMEDRFQAVKDDTR